MKRNLILLSCILFFINAICDKKKPEGINCHYSVKVLNNSSDSVIHALKNQYASDLSSCKLDGSIVKSGASSVTKFGLCLETYLADGKLFECYIVDPMQYNDPQVFYRCDSIEIKNKVLKHYTLTLDDLKRDDFTLVYK